MPFSSYKRVTIIPVATFDHILERVLSLDNSKQYFKPVTGKDLDEYKRADFKARNNFTETHYYKIASMSLKLYKQAVRNGKDIEGNELTSEEINTLEQLIKIAENEISITQKRFDAENGQD